MSQRDDVVAAQVAAIQSGQLTALQSGLGAAYDAGEAAGTGPGFTQADIDAAVAKQQSADAAALDQVQAALDSMTAQDQADVAKSAALQAVIDKIKAALA